jgi:hypothetical protein
MRVASRERFMTSRVCVCVRAHARAQARACARFGGAWCVRARVRARAVTIAGIEWADKTRLEAARAAPAHDLVCECNKPCTQRHS